MTAIALVLGFVGICVLAAFFGADSRFDRPGRQF
jgi:hypothetical protein